MSLEVKKIKTELCVIGGGIAGINVALTASRLGVKTVLVHERPVLGGNASGEIRMWVCGVKDYAYKETGIGEEINLENFYYNPTKNYNLWDSMLYYKVTSQENLTALLNCTCFDAKSSENTINSITAYQMTTQTLYEIQADYFADCSGDSILAPLTGAEFAYGREGQNEYGEVMKTHYEKDKCTMGNSVIIQARQTDKKVPFKAPKWAEKVPVEKLKSKKLDLFNPEENFWYIELGGTSDVISNAENINKRLVALCLGIWDTIKNSGEWDADNFELDFLGFLGAKRESRRLIGDYILTANDILSATIFEDTVAYGGWPLDDHNPEGFDGNKSNYLIKVKKPYGIPYRCLYSKNINNLFFAGRNISATHMALSSARVMGTCGIIGQAVGVAVSIAKKYGVMPREVNAYIKEVQQTLLYNDCYLPNIDREFSPLMKNIIPLKDEKQQVLFNGKDRNLRGENNLYNIKHGESVTYEFDSDTFVQEIKLVFDSDLERKSYSLDVIHTQYATRCNTLNNSPKVSLPVTLVKKYKITIVSEDGISENIYDENYKRNVILPINKKIKKVSLLVLENWGNTQESGVFTFELK